MGLGITTFADHAYAVAAAETGHKYSSDYLMWSRNDQGSANTLLGPTWPLHLPGSTLEQKEDEDDIYCKLT
jgi:hypothetical protein